MRNKNLLRLIYTSRAGVRFDEGSLQALLERARSNNYHNGITGVLSFGNGFFLQVLEGPEDRLITLYAKILADTRHRDCAILDVHLAEQRLFANWSMGYVSDFRKIGGHYNEMLDYRTVREDRDGTLNLLEALLEIVSE
jgi:hypothetical protein